MAVHAGGDMNTRRLITRGTLAVLLVSMAMPAAIAEASLASPASSSEVKSMGVDCIGDGASCEGHLNGTKGEVDVTNNTNPRSYWRFKLTCAWGGDQYSGSNPPSAGTVKSYLGCNVGAPAQYWNVLVDHKP
jgi:hypothetical protein